MTFIGLLSSWDSPASSRPSAESFSEATSLAWVSFSRSRASESSRFRRSSWNEASKARRSNRHRSTMTAKQITLAVAR